MNIEFFKNIHDKEFERRDRLAHRTSAIIAVMTTLAGLLGFLVLNYKPVTKNLDILFWFLTLAAFLSLLFSGCFLAYSYRVSHLNDIDKPSKWLIYWEELWEQYKNNEGNFTSAQHEFTDHLIHLYSEIADENIDSNDRKGKRLVYSNRFLLSSFVFLILTSLTYYFNSHIVESGSPTIGETTMLSDKNAFICIQSSLTSLINSNGKKPEKPGKRPEPDPIGPPPGR